MFPQIFLVTLLSINSLNGEKATSYVSVSKAKEGGYSYEVIHDYPTKDSSASVHFYGDAEDYGDKPSDVSYDYEINHLGHLGTEDTTYSQPDKTSVPVPNKQSYQFPPIHQIRSPQSSFENHNRGNDINDIKSLGVLRHSATSPGSTQPANHAYSSTFVNIKHKMRAHSVGGTHLKSHGTTSYSFDVGNNGVDSAPYRSKESAPLVDFKGNPLDSGGGSIQTSASGPGFAYSNPTNVRGVSAHAAVDYGPIVHHHHHYHGETTDSGNGPIDHHNFNFENGISEKGKSHEYNHGFAHPSNSQHSGHIGSISIATSLGHTCSSNEVTPLPLKHVKNPKELFNFAQHHSYNGGSLHHKENGYAHHDYHQPSSQKLLHGGQLVKEQSFGGKKGKWKPVVVTASQAKGKLHTFRISRDFKPGKLMTGFQPSFGPPRLHDQLPAHLGHVEQGDDDSFSNFHDAPYFDYDSLIASVDSSEFGLPNGHRGSHSFEEFSDFVPPGKSLKDYHNSVSYPSHSTPSNYRRGKTMSLSANPIVVPPLRTTTTSKTKTTVSSPYVDTLRPITAHAFHYVSSRNARVPTTESDQATSYANPSNHSLRRSNKRKND